MLNETPGRLGQKLAMSSELVCSQKPDLCTWIQSFSVGFFTHTVDSDSRWYKYEDQSLPRIAGGRDTQTNTIMIYNQVTCAYYRPPTFMLDKDTLPVAMFPKSITYSGGLACGLMRKNKAVPAAGPFPPGLRVHIWE